MPPRDNSDALARWRKATSQERHDRVRTLLDQLIADAAEITFAGVARQADVSRSWLHESCFAEEIRKAAAQPRPPRAVRQKSATVESLRVRLTDALDDNRRLRDELATVKHQLALALGANREDQLRD